MSNNIKSNIPKTSKKDYLGMETPIDFHDTQKEKEEEERRRKKKEQEEEE